MSDRRVALLRGINVGKAKRVVMGELRALLESLGYTDVQTLLNSGNVAFTEPAGLGGDAAARIEDGLARRLRVSSRVTILTARELEVILARNPLVAVASDPSRLMVAILSDPRQRTKLRPLARRDWAPEVVALGTRAVYFWCPRGVADSAVAKALGEVLGDGVTTRNWSTIQKLQALATGPDPAPPSTRSRPRKGHA
jgi:uncharacterized protein (DUF1697 family)